MSRPGSAATGPRGAGGGRRAFELALTVVRVGLALLFLYAAWTKWIDLRAFAEEVANYRVLPAAWVAPAAVTVVGVEVVAALLLLLGLRVRAASAVVSMLLVAFIAALSQALLRDIDLRCGCFGGVELATWTTVYRDVALLAFASLLLVRGGGAFALDRRLATRR